MNRLTQQHRAQQLLLRRATVQQLEQLWPALDWAQLDATYPRFAVSVAQVVQRNRQTSAGLAAAYLRALRKADGVPGAARAVLATPLNVDQFNASLAATSIAAIKTAAGNGVAREIAMGNALTQVAGSMARLVLDAGRETTLATIQRDPAAVGFERILGGGGCEFCQELAGGVYSADTADFPAHDHCGCTAVPLYAN